MIFGFEIAGPAGTLAIGFWFGNWKSAHFAMQFAISFVRK